MDGTFEILTKDTRCPHCDNKILVERDEFGWDVTCLSGHTLQASVSPTIAAEVADIPSPQIGVGIGRTKRNRGPKLAGQSTHKSSCRCPKCKERQRERNRQRKEQRQAAKLASASLPT